MSTHGYEAGRLDLPFVGISTFGKRPYVSDWSAIDADVAVVVARSRCAAVEFRPGRHEAAIDGQGLAGDPMCFLGRQEGGSLQLTSRFLSRK